MSSSLVMWMGNGKALSNAKLGNIPHSNCSLLAFQTGMISISSFFTE